MLTQQIPAWMLYAFEAYLILFMVVIGALYIWRVRRRQERPPEKFKLLRGPGETLRRRVQKADEDVVLHFGAAAFLPVLLAWGVLILAVKLPRPLILTGLAIALVVFCASLVAAAILMFRFFNRRRNDLLGYLGERAVSEHLDTLVRDGYRVFHDVPAEGREKRFNLDHVVVGPTGIVAVETKTRRKKKARFGSRRTCRTF